MTARAWCFTLNNPSDSSLPLNPNERYVVWQREKGDNGTPHFQGYIELTKPSRLAAMKTWLPGAHFEVRKGTSTQARDYCMKPDTREEGPWERGVFGITQGRRSDLEDAVAVLKDRGITAVAEEHPETFVKFHKGLAALAKALEPEARDPEFVPRQWQQKLLEKLESAADDRKIIWVWDAIGNVGKSRLARNLVCEHGAIVLSGRVADMAFAYNAQPIVIFDVARTQSENTAHLYSFAEQLKNGIIFSSKYESGQKQFSPPHVVFFSNFPPPDGNVWSSDRVDEFDVRRMTL